MRGDLQDAIAAAEARLLELIARHAAAACDLERLDRELTALQAREREAKERIAGLVEALRGALTGSSGCAGRRHAARGTCPWATCGERGRLWAAP